jgi:hypothetical protein
MLTVNKYNTTNTNIISYNNYTYNLNNIPNNVQLVFDMIDEQTESSLINLFLKDDSNTLRSISKCINDEIFKPIGLNFNDYTFSILKKGEGMPQLKDNSYKYGYTTAILNMGTDILFNLKDTSINKVYYIILPRRSLLVITDPNYSILRSISKRAEDIIDYNTVIQREDRYSIVFKKSKI